MVREIVSGNCALACTQTLEQCCTTGAFWLSGAWQLHDTELAFASLCLIIWVNCGLFWSHLLNLLKTVPESGPAAFISLQLIKSLNTLSLRKVLGLFSMSVLSVLGRQKVCLNICVQKVTVCGHSGLAEACEMIHQRTSLLLWVAGLMVAHKISWKIMRITWARKYDNLN